MKKYLWYLLVSSCLFTLFPQSVSAEKTPSLYRLGTQAVVGQVNIEGSGAGTAENNLSNNTGRGYEATDAANANGRSTAELKIEREEKPIDNNNQGGTPDPGTSGGGSGTSGGKTYPTRTTQQAAGATKKYPQTSEEQTNLWLKLLGVELLFITNVFWLLRKEDDHAKD